MMAVQKRTERINHAVECRICGRFGRNCRVLPAELFKMLRNNSLQRCRKRLLRHRINQTVPINFHHINENADEVNFNFLYGKKAGTVLDVKPLYAKNNQCLDMRFMYKYDNVLNPILLTSFAFVRVTDLFATKSYFFHYRLLCGLQKIAAHF